MADPFKESVETLAQRWGCDSSLDCAVVIERDDVDAVLIGTPRDATDSRDPLLNFFTERHAASYRIELDAFLDALEGKLDLPGNAGAW